jgi:hypothetical protein
VSNRVSCINDDLTHALVAPYALTFSLLTDIGW